MVCEEHKDLSVWECVSSRIRDKAKIGLPYEMRGLLYTVVDALDLLRQHKLSPEEAKGFALLVEAGVKVLQTGVIAKEKNFQRRCIKEDRRRSENRQAELITGPSLEELDLRARGIDAEFSPASEP